MGRPLRIQLPGACYYVTLTGNNRQDLFLSNQDRRRFLSLLKAHKPRFELRVYAYCLLDNRAELLIETIRPNLSQVMQSMNTVYTKHFNRVHHSVGHVFQGRYKSLLVDREKYLLETSAWVHVGPARAGLKIRPWRYQWSSCSAYVESEQREPMIDSSAVLRLLAKNRLKQSVKYLQLIQERVRTASKPGFPVHGGCVGDARFAASILESVSSGSAGHVSDSREKARRIIAEIVAGGMSEDRLFGPARWREVTSVRKQAVYRVWKEAKLGVTEIARMFRRTPSAISQIIRALEIEETT